MARISLEGHPELKISSVISTRIDEGLIIPVAALPSNIREELLSLPPVKPRDTEIIVRDPVFGDMRCLERTLKIRVHADNAEWLSSQTQTFVRLDGEAKIAIIGLPFIAVEWSSLLADLANGELKIWTRRK